MEKKKVDEILSNIDVPQTDNIKHHNEFKIPLLSYKKSSSVGLWLLIVPVVYIITFILKYEFELYKTFLDSVESVFTAVSANTFLTYLIPIIFVGTPLFVMIINLLAFSHYMADKTKKELIVTIKYRPLNIVLFLFSFAILIFAFLPDTMP